MYLFRISDQTHAGEKRRKAIKERPIEQVKKIKYLGYTLQKKKMETKNI